MGENLEITSKGYLSLFDHEHYSRGITLHERGAAELLKLLVSEFIDHEQFNELEIDKDELLGFLGGQDVLCKTKGEG